MSTAVVLGLTTAGLAVGFATSAQAADDPRSRNYSLIFMARDASVNTNYDQWGDSLNYFGRNDIQSSASYWYSGPDYTGLTGFANAAGGFALQPGPADWQSTADVNVYPPGHNTDTGHAPSGIIAGIGTYPEATTSAEINLPADGNATPYGEDMINQSATTGPYDLEPQPMYGLPGTVDALDGTTATTTTGTTRLVDIEGTENRAALETVSEGGTGTYTALNGTVTIEIVEGAVGTLLNSGDANTTSTLEPATVKVTGPDQIEHTIDAYSTLTYDDPTTPGLRLTLTINGGNSTFLNAEGRSASMWAGAVSGSYTNTNANTGDPVAKFDLGTLYANTEVPVGGINVSPQPDADNDGLNAYEEASRYLSDTVADFDSDGLLDGAEVKVHQTNPKVADTDTDTLSDGLEVTLGTDPLVMDTDSDWLDDGREHNDTLTDPLVDDTDTDGLNDGAEVIQFLTDPLDTDTDNDALTDGQEVNRYNTDPLVRDTDKDRLLDGAEIANRTNPFDLDSDDDGLKDGAEVNVHRTSPLKADTDRDALTDGQEVNRYNTNPLRVDTDRDDLRDGVEVNGFLNQRYDKTFTSSPLLVDTDKDGLRDRVEVTGAKNVKFRDAPTNPRRADTDNDGFADLREIKARSNPAAKSSTPRNP